MFTKIHYHIQIAHYITAEDLYLSLISVLRIIMELPNVLFHMKHTACLDALPYHTRINKHSKGSKITQKKSFDRSYTVISKESITGGDDLKKLLIKALERHY